MLTRGRGFPRTRLGGQPRPDQVYAIRDVGPYGIWTTVVVKPDHTFDRPLRGFNYSVGSDIPGLYKVTACRSDTNMNVASEFVDETMLVKAVSWRIPPVALAKYQKHGYEDKDYAVTREDVAELVRNAHLKVHTDKGDIEVPLAFVEADAAGSYGASYSLGPNAFEIGRLNAFWVELSFEGAPKLRGALPIIITFDGQRMRGVQ